MTGQDSRREGEGSNVRQAASLDDICGLTVSGSTGRTELRSVAAECGQ
jgi:hypothetical protein